MCYLNNICFVCLNNEDILIEVHYKETDNEIFKQVKCALPEFTVNPKIPVLNICSSCNTTFRSFFLLKKKFLENHSRLNDYINILQSNKDTSGQSFNGVQIIINNCVSLIKNENDIHIKIEQNEVAVQPDQNDQKDQKDQKPEVIHNLEFKEESLPSEDRADRAFYQKLVKEDETVLDDKQNGDSSVISEEPTFSQHFVKCEYISDNEQNVSDDINSALDKDETNSNIQTESQHFKCTICNDMFADRQALDSHLRIHINNITNLICLICKKKCKDKYDLNLHMKHHLGIKDFECIICSKTFIAKSNLNKHMKMHDSIKNNECPFCEKKFSRTSCLNKHMKIHTAVRNFECAICKKRFLRCNDLNTHMKIHTGIKNFECSICKRKFLRRNDLKKHLKIHAGIKDHECSICKKRYQQSGYLKIHMKIHAGIKDYECPICHKKFVRKDKLNRHITIH